MSNITQYDFDEGIAKFLAILERQPNLLHARHTTETEAHNLAQMAVAFSVKYNELRLKHVG